MCKRGFVFREGIVDIDIVKNYAKKHKAAFFDLRRIGFTNIKQLDYTLSRYLSSLFKRPLRTKTHKFMEGVFNEKPFFAVLPHDFLRDLSVFANRESTYELTKKLIQNEQSCLGLINRIRA